MLARGAFSDPATVEALTDGFTPILIDLDADRGTADHYRIRSLPSVVFADHDGKQISLLVGVVKPDQLRATAARALERIDR